MVFVNSSEGERIYEAYLSIYMVNKPQAWIKSYVRGYVEKGSHLQARAQMTASKFKFEPFKKKSEDRYIFILHQFLLK